MPKPAATNASERPGEIAADSMYTLEEIQKRLGLGQAAMRTARRAGLKVRRIGRRGYVLGKDLLAYVESATN